MDVFLISFLVIVTASLGMAVGVIAGRRPIRAGCGIISATDDAEAGCEICGDVCEGDQYLATGTPNPFGLAVSSTGKHEPS